MIKHLKIVLISLQLIITLSVAKGDNPKHEIRGAWITTIYGLDWPKSQATTPQQEQRQRNELCEILDRAKELNLNTIFFQARLRGDVLYQSNIEQYNPIITGNRNINPTYDPLAFAIDECQKRNLQCHAWIVCMNLGTEKGVQLQGKNSVVYKYPNIVTKYQKEWYLNPGEPETQTYLQNIVQEIIENYQVDGIHLDYIRYPDRASDYPDAKQYAKYAAEGETITAWRTNNINKIVYSIYNQVKEFDPQIQVSSAVLGKRNSLPKFPSYGWSGVEAAYQDAAAWLKADKQDFLAPMLYYDDDSYYPFVKDWVEHSNNHPIVIGSGTYRLLKSSGDWGLDKLMPQLYIARQMGAVGAAFFRMQQVMDNEKGIATEMQNNLYPLPALYPPIKNAPDNPILPPQNLTISNNLTTQTISWDYVEWAKFYTLYSSDSYPVDISKAENILATNIDDLEYKTHMADRYYAVTATDNFYRESDATQQPLSQINYKEGSEIVLPQLPYSDNQQVEIYTAIGNLLYKQSDKNPNIPTLTKGLYYIKTVHNNGVELYPLSIY